MTSFTSGVFDAWETAMPSYSFDLGAEPGSRGHIDGQHLTDDQAAIKEASVAAAEVLLSELSDGPPTREIAVTVSREGTPIIRVTATARYEVLT